MVEVKIKGSACGAANVIVHVRSGDVVNGFFAGMLVSSCHLIVLVDFINLLKVYH